MVKARTAAARKAQPRRAGEVHVALLRGVNVGGKNRLAMADLAAMFERAGCCNVRTYIQSGNVVFEAPAPQIAAVHAAVRKALEAHMGRGIGLTLRTARELRALAGSNPFLRRGVVADELHLAFLAETPAAGSVAALDRERSKPDAFEVRGREIYLHLPNGMARTKFTNDYFDRTLRTTSTVRNWRTVLALCELAGA